MLDEAIDESFPASDPPAEDHDGDGGKPRTTSTGRPSSPSIRDQRRGRRPARGRRDGRARPRPRRDRGDHELHQHLEPLGDARRRAARQEGGRARPAPRKPWVKTSLAPGSTVVTEYLEKSGLDKYLDKLQFNLVGYGCTTCIGNSGPLPGGDLEGGQRQRPGRLLGALGQPQLRGPDQPRHAGQLPRLAAAGGRLRARRADGHRPDQRAARPRLRRRARLPLRHLAELRGDQARWWARRSAPTCSPRATPTSSPATSAGSGIEVPEGDRYTWPDSTYVRKPSFFEGMDAEPEAASSRSRARACSPCSATRSPPTTSRPPARSRRTARPASG